MYNIYYLLHIFILKLYIWFSISVYSCIETIRLQHITHNIFHRKNFNHYLNNGDEVSSNRSVDY